MYRKQFSLGIGVWLLLLVVMAAYLPGLSGPFLLDDFHNLQPLALYGGVGSLDDALRFIFGAGGDSFSRSGARLTFLLDDQTWPSLASVFKFNNLLIHLLCICVFALILIKVTKIIGQSGAGLIVALSISVWALAPAQVSTVVYVVQRMTLLMTLGVLLTLYFYISFRVAIVDWQRWLYFLISGLSFLFACLSKENALVVLLLVPLVEYSLFSVRQRWLEVLLRLSVLLFVGVFTYYAIDRLGVYDGRVFSVWERFFSQGVVLFNYVFYFFNVSTSYTIFHDDVEAGLDATFLALGAAAWVVHISIIYFSVKKRLVWGWVAFGVVWFYLCHIIESTIIPLELMYEHRNYLPSIGLAIIAASVISKLYQALVIKNLKLVASTALVLLPVVFLGGLIYQVHIWSDYRILSSKWAADYPKSLRAQMGFVGMLEVNSMGGIALNNLDEMRQNFDDPQVDINYLLAQCRAGEDVDKLDSNVIANKQFSSGVLHSLGEAMAFDGVCVEENVSGGLIGLIEAVGEMPLLKAKPRYEARYHDIIGNYYVREMLYEKAVVARERAWQLQPTIATSLKTAELFILGGNYPLARQYLGEARRLDQSRWFRDHDAEEDIRRLAELLDLLEVDN